MFAKFTYRLYRLRRMIVAAIALPLAIVALIWLGDGPFVAPLAVIAILGPLVHVLRYPTVWTETFAVSLTLSLMIGLVGLLGPVIIAYPAAMVWSAVLTPFVSLAIFMALTVIMPPLLEAGPRKAITIISKHISHLDVEKLSAELPARPGKRTPTMTYGDLNDDNLFPVRFTYFAPDMPWPDDIGYMDAPDTPQIWCRIILDTPEEHQSVVIDQATGDTVAVRILFQTVNGGTQVVTMEESAPMTPLMRWGMWLQDFAGDSLMDQIDDIENRAPRSNRRLTQNMLLVDIARLFPKPQTDIDPF